MYDSVTIVDIALAVGVRVQYTGRMLWKSKKHESHTQSVPQAAPPSTSPSVAGNGGERAVVSGADRVENTDVVGRVPHGSFVVPASYRMSGTIVTPRHVIVEGQLEGNALVAPSVYVTSTGRLNAPTQAATITVAGIVQKPVAARELLEVRSGGALQADAEAGSLTIQPGGHISGARLAIGPLRGQE
ncbi:MAG: Polymer-forming cytoskeletal [Pseudomonadota bacterium]